MQFALALFEALLKSWSRASRGRFPLVNGFAGLGLGWSTGSATAWAARAHRPLSGARRRAASRTRRTLPGTHGNTGPVRDARLRRTGSRSHRRGTSACRTRTRRGRRRTHTRRRSGNTGGKRAHGWTSRRSARRRRGGGSRTPDWSNGTLHGCRSGPRWRYCGGGRRLGRNGQRRRCASGRRASGKGGFGNGRSDLRHNGLGGSGRGSDGSGNRWRGRRSCGNRRLQPSGSCRRFPGSLFRLRLGGRGRLSGRLRCG